MERFKKILLFIINIIKWPAIYLVAPVLASWGMHFILKVLFGSKTISDSFGEYPLAVASAIIVLICAAGIITSTYFTDYYLVSTGIASGTYLLTSLFITAPSNWSDVNYQFDTLKIIAFGILAGSVLLGDTVVMIVRKIRRIMRNKRSDR